MLKIKSNLLSKNLAELNFSITKAVESTEAEGGGLIIQGYANTVRKDRAGDVIPREAWENGGVENFKKNPILLAFHNHSLPIGQVTTLEVTDEGLWIEARVSEAAPNNLYELIKDGVLKTFSVGFRALEVDYDDSMQVFVIKDLELLEVSVVSVPCNQDSTFSLAKSMDTSNLLDILKSVNPTKPKFKTEVEKLLYMLHNNSNTK